MSSTDCSPWSLIAVELRPGVCHGGAMRGSSTKAGGIFLTLFILGGLVAGVAIGNPMLGVLAGTAAGVVAAGLLWLIDRRKTR
jgi:hypothetical protein